MAYIPATAILTRIREVIEDQEGALRTIDECRFTGDMHDGLSPLEQSRRGMLSRAPAEASITRLRPHPQQLTITCGVNLVLADVQIKIVRTLGPAEQVDDALRDQAKALASEDAIALRQALEWPPNLQATRAGVATDIGHMTWVDSRPVLGPIGTSVQALRLTTIHTFEATVTSRPAVA